MKRYSFPLSILLFSIITLSGCQQSSQPVDAPIIAPETKNLRPSISASPEPSPSPSPSPSAQPTPSAVSYTIDQFFPNENFFIQFKVRPSDTQENSYVEYREKNSSRELVQRRITTSNGQPYIEIYRYDNKTIMKSYAKKDVGYTYNVLSNSSKRGEILLSEPIELGTSWDVEGGTSKITSLNLLASLPLGQVRTVEVETSYDSGEKRRMLFMPDVGLVAEYHYGDDDKLTRIVEASQYERDKSFSQSIRFFYSDPRDNSIYYVNRRVSVPSNPDMGSIFCEHLANAPSEDLLPMSSSVKILSIELSGRSLYVDFSDAIVMQMDLPRKNERAFLQALANTFGDYYQVKYVYFTIEGDSYASKHMMLLDDECFEPNVKNSVALDQ